MGFRPLCWVSAEGGVAFRCLVLNGYFWQQLSWFQEAVFQYSLLSGQSCHVQVLTTGTADAPNTVLQVVKDVPHTLGSGAYEQHLLPYVPEIIPTVVLSRQQALARPPPGLLELGRRDMRLRQIQQELQVKEARGL